MLNPLDNLNLDIDAYQIDIRDRIVSGGTVSGNTALAALAEAGFTVASNLAGGEVTTSYFTNGADTRSRGLNLTGAYLTDFAAYRTVKWGFTGHENIYGPTTDDLEYFSGPNAYSTSKFYAFHEPVKVTTDIALHYALIRNLQLTVGAINLFNVYPDKIPAANQYLGVPYDTTSSQMGIFGEFYYVDARYMF